MFVANSVYMYDVPPPYPGIDPTLPAAYPPQPQVNGHYPPVNANANAAAAEAPYAEGPQSAAAGLYVIISLMMMTFSVTCLSYEHDVRVSVCNISGL